MSECIIRETSSQKSYFSGYPDLWDDKKWKVFMLRETIQNEFFVFNGQETKFLMKLAIAGDCDGLLLRNIFNIYTNTTPDQEFIESNIFKNNKIIFREYEKDITW